MLLVGLSVFVIRVQHAGPYALPEDGNLLAGTLALLLGGWLVRPWLGAHRLAGLGDDAALEGQRVRAERCACRASQARRGGLRDRHAP